MNIVITAQELLNKEIWEEACELLGINVYAVAEGMDPNTEYVLTEEQARELGIIQ